MNPLVFLVLLFIVVLALVVLAVVARKLAPVASAGTNVESIYAATPALLTPAERSFFGVLQQVVPQDFRLFAKVRLADVIQPRSTLGASTRQSAFNKISSKHVDFVLCDAATTKVICVIELDDSSHQRGSRQARDNFVDASLLSASVPILRFSVKQGYAPEQIRAELAKVMPMQREFKGDQATPNAAPLSFAAHQSAPVA